MLHALFVLLVFCPIDSIIIDLNGKWTLSNSTTDGIPASVPGGVHTALMQAGILGDPYYRKNDATYLWVGRGDWRYTRTFKVPAEVLQMDLIMLICEGLDTVATVRINNKTVGQTDNMFVRYIYAVKNVLKENNVITVDLESPVNYGKKKAETVDNAIPPDCPPYYFHGECHRNMVRKMQCAFSWDWAPAFVSMGIWKNIYIVATHEVLITDLTTETLHNDGIWTLRVYVYIVPNMVHRGQVFIALTIDDADISFTKKVKIPKDSEPVFVEYNIPKKAGIVAWWPRGYGPQSLYNLTVSLKDELGVTLAEKTTRIGFRTVQLVQEPVSVHVSDGLSFFFRINDHPIFLKGSNWVPSDSFPERVTKDRLRNYLQSAVDANMNCLRVWGGGIYETDYFYDLADELGILIWQDFMFACAMYPVDDSFLASVREEIVHQVRRLKNHPSVFAYNGNNENEAAITGGWWPGAYRNQRLMSDYIKLYINTIQRVVEDEDPTRPFILSSPSNGAKTIMDGGISSGDPGDTRYGDIHDYQYSRAFYEDFTYKIPRMATEYGLQSFPSLESLAQVYDPRDLVYESDLNAYRQHHVGGNFQMQHLVSMYMFPPNSSSPYQRFEDIIYCTQIVQAVAMRTETEHYRRWQNNVTHSGEGKTMGALYWMFADIWQAPSWASIEYGGKWKMLHYYARHFFSPVLISTYIDEDTLHVFIVADELPEFQRMNGIPLQKITEDERPFSTFTLRSWKDLLLNLLKANDEEGTGAVPLLSGTVYMRVYSWDNMTTKYTEEIVFELRKPAEQIYEVNVTSLVRRSGCISAEYCFVVLYFEEINSELSSWYPLSTFKNAKGIKIANVRIDKIEESNESGIFNLQLVSDNVAPFVWLEAGNIKGRFSDNGFLMFLAHKTVQFYAWQTTDVTRLKDCISVKSLMDIYY